MCLHIQGSWILMHRPAYNNIIIIIITHNNGETYNIFYSYNIPLVLFFLFSSFIFTFNIMMCFFLFFFLSFDNIWWYGLFPLFLSSQWAGFLSLMIPSVISFFLFFQILLQYIQSISLPVRRTDCMENFFCLGEKNEKGNKTLRKQQQQKQHKLLCFESIRA